MNDLIATMLPSMLPALGAAAALVAAGISIMDLRKRLQIEKQLAQNLAEVFKARGIDAQVSVALEQVRVFDELQPDDIEQFKGHVSEAVDTAVAGLPESDRALVQSTLTQHSRRGQFAYLRKVVRNSLAQLQQA